VSASGANAGYTNIYYQDIWASDCSFIDSKITPYVFFFYTLLAENQRGITHMQKGSAQPHVYPVDLERLEIPDFTDDAIKTLNEILSPIYDLIGVLKAKNQLQAKIRDLLLATLH
jgi:type I restriction enzyme S subunit